MAYLVEENRIRTVAWATAADRRRTTSARRAWAPTTHLRRYSPS